jgi:hypothetical protein
MNSRECRVTRQEIEQSEFHQRLSDPALTHTRACVGCRDFHGERTRLRELVGSLEPVVAPGDFDMRLRARIAAEHNGGARVSFFQRFVVSTPAMAVAALIVMLTGTIVWFAQHQREQQSSIAAGNSASTEQGVKPADDAATTKTTSPVVDSATNPPTQVVVKGSTPEVYRATGGRKSAGVRAPASDFYAKGAESIRQGEQRAGEVSLRAPVKPMVVSLEDEKGGKRKISLPPVSFGSQRLVDNRIPVISNNSRSW